MVNAYDFRDRTVIIPTDTSSVENIEPCLLNIEHY